MIPLRDLSASRSNGRNVLGFQGVQLNFRSSGGMTHIIVVVISWSKSQVLVPIGVLWLRREDAFHMIIHQIKSYKSLKSWWKERLRKLYLNLWNLDPQIIWEERKCKRKRKFKTHIVGQYFDRFQNIGRYNRYDHCIENIPIFSFLILMKSVCPLYLRYHNGIGHFHFIMASMKQ